MRKKALAVSSPLHKDGKSDVLCGAFTAGAKGSGDVVIKYRVDNL